MLSFQAVGILYATAVTAASYKLSSPSFDISIDETSEAVLSISHPNDTAQMNWISGPNNVP